MNVAAFMTRAGVRGVHLLFLSALFVGMPDCVLLAAPLFVAPTHSVGVGENPRSIAVGDLNCDGRPDLTVGNVTSSTVSILLGSGDGTFSDRADLPGFHFPQAVGIGDFNADGRNDFAVANYTNPGTVSVLLGNGDGTFAPMFTLGTVTWPTYLAVADINADGEPDLAVTNYDNNIMLVSIFLGNGDGTFASRMDFETGRNPVFVTLKDLNSDGDMDLVTAGDVYLNGTVSVLLGNGDGTFLPKRNFGPLSYPHSLDIGDLNSDGAPDLAVSNAAGVSIMLGSGDGSFGSPTDLVGWSGYSVRLSDLDGDRKLDLILPKFSYNTVLTMLGNGDGSFGTPDEFETGSNPQTAIVGDLNGDDEPDLIVSNYYSESVSILLNSPGTTVWSPRGGESWVSGDVDTVRWSTDLSSDVAQVSIDYSTTEGQTWNSIYVGGNNSGRFPWTIPASGSTQTLLRVVATNVHGIQFIGRSEAPFHILSDLAPPPTAISRWGSAGTAVGQFHAPAALAIDAYENLYVADTGNHRVEAFSFSGALRFILGSLGSAPGHLYAPEGVCAAHDGSVLVSDTGNNRVQRFSISGVLLDLWGQAGSGAGQFNHPAGIAEGPDGSVYVADLENHRIQKFDAYGQYMGTWGDAAPGPSQLLAPTGVATWGSNRVYVTDAAAGRVKVFDAAGALISSWPVNQPSGISTDTDGNVFVVDGASRRVLRFTPEGILDTRWGGLGAAPGQFQDPVGVGVHGNGGTYSAHVLDRSQPSVQRFVRYAVSGVGDGASAAPAPLALVPVENPFRGTLTLRVTGLAGSAGLSPEAQLTLVVTDVSGKLVSRRGLGRAVQDWDGPITWDGRDPSGRVVAPGVYFVSLIGDGRQLAYMKVVRAE